MRVAKISMQVEYNNRKPSDDRLPLSGHGQDHAVHFLKIMLYIFGLID